MLRDKSLTSWTFSVALIKDRNTFHDLCTVSTSPRHETGGEGFLTVCLNLYNLDFHNRRIFRSVYQYAKEDYYVLD